MEKDFKVKFSKKTEYQQELMAMVKDALLNTQNMLPYDILSIMVAEKKSEVKKILKKYK